MPRSTRNAAPASPQASLTAAIKSARDTMRKDAGLNGDLDRIPQLAWLLFLKAFDGQEQNREVVEDDYRPAIEPPYRWRDWADNPNEPTGDALLRFVNDGLLPYLRALTGTGSHDPRDVLATVFKETNNRMVSGYLLRDVVNKVNEIDLSSSADIHTMAHLYESMLREMRDAAGDSGEFYTPRPVIRFMVQQVDPKIGEIVLDPACGTGGFLVEALEHVMPAVRTGQQLRTLHENLRGIEKKPLPYLLGMMNLVLHGVGQPNITRSNALARPITEIRRSERVEVIVTNPPFGGEEEKSIQAGFPADKQTGETAWLFMQLVIRKLNDGGRCAIIVPNGVLFADGVGARIKRELLTECDLHTVVRLPDGVFTPYTSIPANLLFFTKTGRTRTTWFYQIPPPEGRKNYSKTRPMRFEEFADCQAWWNDRQENERAWQVPVADLEANGFNLDLRNPNRPEDLAHRSPDELIAELLRTEGEIITLLEQLAVEMEGDRGRSHGDAFDGWKRVAFKELAHFAPDVRQVDPHASYEIAGIYSFGRGLFSRGVIQGADTKYTSLHRLRTGQLVMSRLKAWEGALAIVPPALDGCYVSHEFPTFDLARQIDAEYLDLVVRAPVFWQQLASESRGVGARRERVNADRLLSQVVDLPPLAVQREIARKVRIVRRAEARAQERDRLTAALVPALLNEAFAGPP